MRSTVLGALLVLGMVAACSDDPVTTIDATEAQFSAAAATDPLSKVNRLPASLEQKVQLVRADLESSGFAVARGYWTLWGVEQCRYPLQAIGYCYGNNPTAPYALAVVPTWRDEFHDQRMHHALTQAQRAMSAVYRLDGREALVILAELPPAARYFGLGTNVFTREGILNESDPILGKVAQDPLLQGILFGASPDPARRMMVSSIGDAINNVTIERRSQAVWGQHRYFVITPDEDMADVVTAALLRAGVPSADDIFVERVSPSLVRVGLGRSADDLITYVRYAMPQNEAAGDKWRQVLPLTVLRVRDHSASTPARPFAVPPYATRSANFDERPLAADLAKLVGAVRTHWQQPDARVLTFFSAYRYLDLVGQHCLGYPDPARGPMDCLGDTQDADYQISQSMHIDDGEVIAVMGTLAKETGNATYVSLSINWFPQLVGVANVSDVQLLGTAAQFAAALDHASRYFYVYYVARDCAGLEHCVEVSRKQVPIGEIIKVIQRNYLNPGTTAGPDPVQILNPLFLVLDGRQRPAQQ